MESAHERICVGIGLQRYDNDVKYETVVEEGYDERITETTRGNQEFSSLFS